jgi:hypothetical protein
VAKGRGTRQEKDKEIRGGKGVGTEGIRSVERMGDRSKNKWWEEEG